VTGGVEVAGQGVLVAAGRLHPEVGVGPGPVPVGPGEQGGVAAGRVGERLLPGRPVRGQEAGVQGGLADIDPDEHGRANGVPPLKLTMRGRR